MKVIVYFCSITIPSGAEAANQIAGRIEMQGQNKRVLTVSLAWAWVDVVFCLIILYGHGWIPFTYSPRSYCTIPTLSEKTELIH